MDLCNSFLVAGLLSAVSLCVTAARFDPNFQPYRLCVLSDDESIGLKYCRILEKAKDGTVICVYGHDRLECLHKVTNGEADFGVFKAEDLLLAPNFDNSQDLVITGEMRLYKNQTYEFDMVALVSNEIEIKSLEDLRGKRFCHPGFDEAGYLDDWSEMFSQFFEDSVVPQVCDRQLSILENRIKSVAEFFDSSCKPGAWSPNPDIDFNLKRKYSKVCNNCNSPDICSRNDLYWGRQGPIYCMIDCRGDVAWARLQDIWLQIKDTSLQCHDVSFLCPDGSTRALHPDEACVWISRPWPVIVSRQSVADAIVELIRHINVSKKTFQSNAWEGAVRVLLGYSFQPIHDIIPTRLIEYLQKIPNFLNANTANRCRGYAEDKKINVCVKSNDELNKCQLMASVANIFNINPQFGCVFSQNCVKDVADNNADVAIVNTEDVLNVARMKKLKTILYQTSDDYAFLRHVSAVVRSDSGIRSLKDLKGKKACFVNANGFGWNSFVLALKNASLLPESDNCSPTVAVSEFFSDVCVIDNSRSPDIRTCFPDELPGEYKASSSMEWNETLALRCITDGGGDVAFIHFDSITKYIANEKDEEWTSSINGTHFRQVCPQSGVEERECYLTWASYGQVVVNKNVTDEREEEITSAFLLLCMLFGGHSHTNQPLDYIFKLFAPFNNKYNILFEDSTQQLQTPNDFFSRGLTRRSNYESQLSNIVSCEIMKQTRTSSAIQISLSAVVWFTFVLSVFFFA